MKRLGMIALLIVGLAACGDDSDEGPTGTVETTEDTTGQVGKDKDATDASNYDVAYGICSTASTEKLVNDLGAASSDPADIADAYAEGYTDAFKQAGYEGCLDGLTGQPRDWP